MKKRVTTLNAVLADWDEGKLPNGNPKYFSVMYVKKSGEAVYIKRAVRSGLRADMKANDLKAAQPVDKNGNPIGHIHPIWIHSILFYSGNIVYDPQNLEL